METPGKVHIRLDPASTAHAEEPQLEKSVEKQPIKVRPSPLVDHARVPYPARLKHQKYAKEYGQFLEMFKQLKINLPFIEALQSMPKYAKFLKDLLKRKDRIGELSNIPLTGGCSAVVLNKLPEKLTDPGIFTIPCLFGGAVTPAQALADLGASINLMPFSLYEKLGLGELTPTRMSLSLADRSVKYPRGIVENLLVKVDKFIFPVDFVVLDMEADERVPIILGRPFLRTAKAIIDVFDGKISLRAGDDIVTFEIARDMQHPSGGDDHSDPCHSVYFLESFISCDDHCLDYISGADLVNERVDKEEKPLTAPEMLETKFYLTDLKGDMSDVSEVDKDDIHSWEEEFGDELVNMPTPNEEEFDPLGDLNALEALLFEEPSLEIEDETHQEIEESVDVVLEMDVPPLYNCDSRPVREDDSGSPSRQRVPRERARESKDRHVSSMHRWSIRDSVSLPCCRKDHSPHYMPRLKFGPGKFKYWWPDPFESCKICFKSINKCFKNNNERVELNGLDMGWIKEKPPD